MKPTPQQYQSFQNIFDFFNTALFAGKLPDVILSFSRKANTRGFFAPQRWKKNRGNKKDHTTHEIALNPQSLRRDPRIALSTLVHEMVHLWQEVEGKPSRTGYHNKQWATKMEEIGLIPSSTGEPGGKRVGQSMTHYVKPNGPYLKAYQKMPRKYLLPFGSLETDDHTTKKKRNDKAKFSCPDCNANAWGKASLHLVCGDCEITMQLQN